MFATRTNKPYCLTDQIYLKLVAFFHLVAHPRTGKEKIMAKIQKARRKVVKRAFGVLQAM